ncbi:MAG: hypothetical protein ACLQBB_14190 [Solirubrobacteraceae bacterium]
MSSPTHPTTAQANLPSLPGSTEIDALSLLDPFAIDARRGSPDDQVLAAMARAERIHGELRARGMEIRFGCPPDGPPVVALVGADGELLRTLTPAEAAEIAMGGDGS